MYSSKSRPVPSKGALRVLYQLAYISSGAALGVGVLCAEERRRRTQIIQRIADNARILRQSPRCVHNAAASHALLEPPLEFEDEQWDTEETPSHRKRRRRKHGLEGDVPWWAAQLPSVVEAEYNHLQQRDQNGILSSVPRKRQTRRADDTRQLHKQSAPWGLPDHSHFGPEYDTGRDDGRLHSFSRSANKSHSPHGTVSRQSSRTTPRVQEDAHELSPSKAIPQRLRVKSIDGERGCASFALHLDDSAEYQNRLTTWTKARADSLAGVGGTEMIGEDSALAACEAKSGKADARHDVLDEPAIPIQQLASQIKDFFAHTNNPLPDRKLTASKLLEVAKVYGSLNDIKALVSWKLANDDMRATDFVNLCCIAALLANRLDHETLMAFYIELMQTSYYDALGSKAKARSSAGILHAGLKMSLGMDTSVLFEQCMRPITSPNDLKHFAKAVMAKVARHLEKGSITTAGSLFWQCGRRLSLPAHSLADRLFSSALSNGAFLVAVRSLQWKLNNGDPEDVSAQINQLVATLEEGRAWNTLVLLFEEEASASSNVPERYSLSPGQVYPEKSTVPDKPCLPSKWLSWDALRSIALAFANKCGDESQISSRTHLLSRLPAHLQEHARALNASVSLRSLWLSTSDLQHVKDRHSFALADMWPHERERTTELNLELVETLILAGKPEEAVESMRSIVKSADSHSAMVVAFGIAQNHQWEALNRLFRMLKEYSPQWSPTSRRMFHHILRLYADDHSAEELWSFAVHAIEQLKVELNDTTAGLMIGRFTAQGAIDLILPWIDYVKTTGLDYTMTAHTVNELIRAWYLNFRPPHKTVLRVSRQIAASDLSLTNKQLVEIVKESIGYDMRRARPGSHERETACYRAHVLSELLSQTSQQPLHLLLDAVVAADSNSVGRTKRGFLTNSKKADRPLEPGRQKRQARTDDTLESGSSVELAGSTDQLSTSMADPVAPLMLVRHEVSRRASDTKIRAVERDMLFALSSQDYDGVLCMYDQSLRLDGAPLSLRSLEIAIEASLLRQKGDPTDAERILCQARKAGVGVNCAIGQILTHQIKKLNLKKVNANKDLRATVINYYRSNEACGKPAKHHIATAAAERLLESGSPELAIDLLDDVLRSHWAAQKPFEIITMTVYLKCFAMLRDFEGVKKIFGAVWVSERMQLGRSFADALRSAQHLFRNRTDPDRLGEYSKEQINEELSKYRQMYRERSHGQVTHAIRVGTRLGNTILKIAKMQKSQAPALEDSANTSTSVLRV